MVGTDSMRGKITIRLSALMFLQYFIWGSWYVTMGTYLAKALQAGGVQIGQAYSVVPIATIFSPLLVGWAADRYSSSRNLLMMLYGAGAILLYFISTTTDFSMFYMLLLVYSLLYAPTISLSTSLALKHTSELNLSFPKIRFWGTVGWICTGIFIDQIFSFSADQLSYTFIMAGVASLLAAIVTLSIADKREVPVSGESVSSVFSTTNLKLLKDRYFIIFFIAALLVCIPLAFYYAATNLFLNNIGMKDVTSTMTLGQVSEALFLLMIPFFLRKFGVKWMILAGIGAWILRFIFFSFGDVDQRYWMLLGGIILHGICYDFFFVTGQMYVDRIAPAGFKNSVQSLLTMCTYGAGMWLGSLLSGYTLEYYTMAGEIQWDRVWMVPAVIATIIFIFFGLFFKEKQKSYL